MAHALDFQRVLSHSFASSRQSVGCPTRLPSRRWSCNQQRSWQLNASLESNGPSFLSALYGQLRPTKLQALAWDLEARVMTNGIGLENVDYKGLYVNTPQVVDLPFLWQRLEPLVQYLPPREQNEVRHGLEVAFHAHNGQCRKSGEPFITHPVEVTRILAELRMDYESLIAGLLHDTVEDTDLVTFASIEQRFGPNVRKIVEGETKLSKITKYSSSQDIAAAAASGFELDEKARDLQQLFLAMTEEVRIILVKLADRLHNMRTLDSMAPHKQKKIAQETLTVFAPLAKLLGLNCIKDELEELSFRYSDPDKYSKIVRSFDKLTTQHRSLVLRAREDLQSRLDKDPVLAQSTHGVIIRLRQKSLYAVHKKLASSQKSLKDLQSVVLFQIIVQEKKDGDASRYSVAQQLCYHVLGLVHSLWSPVPGSLKDYIATPKTNGYQSLHTTVLPLTVLDREDCNLIPVDIQIRTARMDLLAEFGVAAKNWLQREGRMNGAKVPPNPYSVSLKNLLPFPFSNGHSSNGHSKADSHEVLNSSLLRPQRLGQWIDSDSQQAEASVPDSPDWMAEIRKWQEDFVGSVSAREFVDGVTNDVLGQSVFVFTPKGGMRRLPKGATVVDFAYHLHTEVGNLMRSAKVNGKYVPFNHELNNGEVVEIIKGESTDGTAVRLREQWLKFVKTRTAKYKIKQFLKDRTGNHTCTASADEPAPMEIPQEIGLWLTVLCDNKPGVLAGVCSIISKHGCNIKTYSGRPEASCDGSIMHFNLEPIDLATLEVVCDEIEHLPTVQKIEFGSNWPMP